MAYRIIFVMILVGLTMATSTDWTKQCNNCKCVWASGKRTANCTNIKLYEIPKDLSPEIREIDFSNNPLDELLQKVFDQAHLRDVHKLKFQNCSIQSVHRTALSGLELLIELDLSRNKISELDTLTFRDNIRLRILLLDHNRLKRLDDGLFYNMTHLQRISLNNNAIASIGENVFGLLPALQHINIGYNRLKSIEYDFTKKLPKLNSLNLEGNPWICDCRLQDFRNKTISENLITAPTECMEPERLKGRMWSDTTIIFACLPQIIEPLPSTQIEARSSNITLTCRVLGEPQPDVDWVTNGRIIDKDPRQNTQRFITSKSKIGDYTWNNLTITNLNYRDRGEYKCIAKNPGGVDEKNISLIVLSTIGNSSGGIVLNDQLALIIGLSVGAIVILLIILILICCCCKRNSNVINAKRRNLQISDECIDLHGQPEMEKALITDVNPVMKPPRVCSVPPSVNSGGTEVSEVKKNLLDSDSVFAGDDESHSLDFEQHPFRKSQNLLEPDYRGHQMYPPDLLPFPPRISQVSPAGSSASTVADTSRLPAHHGPQSPLHSPLYDQINLYRTLPYSRSQSPFVSGVALPRIPRQGYVTIPRRPRQSWSSEPPLTSDIGEPLYDNLGLRTTVDGSSASLNTLGEATSPKSIRIFPLSPTNCDPIAEHESPPTVATTLPRNLDAVKLSPSRTNWAKANADALRTPEYTQRRNSLPSSDGKKVPPLPPPKPKKRTSTGPLFEDEGEDGTEV